jgi:hypothetical protein
MIKACGERASGDCSASALRPGGDIRVGAALVVAQEMQGDVQSSRPRSPQEAVFGAKLGIG